MKNTKPAPDELLSGIAREIIGLPLRECSGCTAEEDGEKELIVGLRVVSIRGPVCIVELVVLFGTHSILKTWLT